MSIDWGGIIESVVDGAYNSPTEKRQQEIIDRKNEELSKMFQMNEKMQKYLLYGGIGFATVMLASRFIGNG